MGVDAEFKIPIIEFRSGSSDMERGTEGWHCLCKRVREACETYGGFEVIYEKISKKFRNETFAVIKELAEEVPLENKQKNANPTNPYHGYLGPSDQISKCEGFGIEDASKHDSIKSFAQLMWPHGHHHFCENVNSMVKQIEELNNLIWLMLSDSYGLGDNWESKMMRYNVLLRMMRYPSSGEYEWGLPPHTDKPASTIVCEDQVSGLEIEVNDGQWIKLSLSPSSFFFSVGDALMAWSNGRMKAMKHRVMMSGNKDRYSIAAFAVPAEGNIIKAPEELIDEQHPQRFKDFYYKDFLTFTFSDQARHIDSADQIYAFASLSPVPDQKHAHIGS